MAVVETKDDKRHYKELEEKFTVKSCLILCFPLVLRDKNVYGAVQIIDTHPDKTTFNLDKNYLEQLQNLVDICSIALGNAMLYNNEKQKALDLETNLEAFLKQEQNKNIIIGQSSNFQQCLNLVDSYADTEFHVLITGESGTGKELIAEKIHKSSRRKNKPFLVQNCSAIPDTLLESELFGYKKGAFTGAIKDRIGLFEAADGGTVFLDEIGDMPMNIQASLLRVLQKNEIKPLGETKVRHIDVRIVTATNKNIKQMIEENSFRQDLFYRLSVLPVHLPPLRERQEDILLLIKHFLAKECAKAKMPKKEFSTDAIHLMMTYAWPGNIRELENLIRYLIVTTQGDVIEIINIPSHVRNQDSHSQGSHSQDSNIEPSDNHSIIVNEKKSSDFIDMLANMTWSQLEKEYVLSLLKKKSWNITLAAKSSGINRSTFASRMRKLKIKRVQPQA